MLKLTMGIGAINIMLKLTMGIGSIARCMEKFVLLQN